VELTSTKGRTSPSPGVKSEGEGATPDQKGTKGRKRKRKDKVEERPVLAEGEPLLHPLPPCGAPWVNLIVTIRNGKYKGCRATVLGLAKKKYRVQVPGVDYQLEFYHEYVGLPAPPEGYVNAPAPAAPKPATASVPVGTNASSLGIMPDHASETSAANSRGGAVSTNPRLLTSGGQHYMLVSASSQHPTLQRVGSGVSITGSEACTANQSGSGSPFVMVRTGSVISGSSQKLTSEPSAENQKKEEFRKKYTCWVGQSLVIQRGKYKGRTANILGLTVAKMQVSVPGVEHQLEYYPTMFEVSNHKQGKHIPNPVAVD